MEQKKLATQTKGSHPLKGILSYDLINLVAYLLFSFTKSDNKPKIGSTDALDVHFCLLSLSQNI